MQINSLAYIFVALAVVFTMLFLVVRTKRGGVWGLLTKIVASLVFFIAGAVGIILGNFQLSSASLLLTGLLFALLGDVLLDLKVIYKEHSNIYLASGMISFCMLDFFLILMLYNTFYFTFGALIIAFLASVVFALAVMLVAKYVMKLNFEKFFYLSLFYTFILSFALAMSIVATITNVKIIILTIGIALVLLSDLVLSTMYFGGKQDDKKLCVINHSLYYAGMILIAITPFIVF